jgi:hypothetical protein
MGEGVTPTYQMVVFLSFFQKKKEKRWNNTK